MKRLLTLATTVSLAVNARAEAVYAYDDADRLNYSVSIPSGETAEISSGAIALLNENSVTNFIKRGDGTLVVGSVLDSYTGSVCVEDGIYRMAPSKTDNTACGVRSGGGVIVVSDGATLSLRTTIQGTSLSGKKIVFGGRGHNGMGALYVEPETSANQESATFGNNFELTSDTLVRNAANVWFRFCTYWKTMDMNGHALTFSNSGNYSRQVTVGFAGASSGNEYDVKNPGPIYGIEGGIRFANNYWQNLSGNANILTISNNATFCFNVPASTATRKLIMAPGSRFLLNNGVTDNSWYNNWGGPVQLDGDELIPIDSPIRTYTMYLSGTILSGGLLIRQPMFLHLYRRWSANNLDKGIVVANGGTVNVWYKDCLTASCGPLVVTNGCVNFRAASEAESALKHVLSLPTAVMHGNTTVTNGYGWWKGCLTKTGTGNLVYESWIGAPELHLEGGSFIMPKTTYSGTLLNVPELPVFTNLTATGGTEIDFGGKSYSVKNLVGATSLVDCPAFTVDEQWTISADDAIAGNVLETLGSFAFGVGASVALELPTSTVRGTHTYTVLTAQGGVTGFTPGVVADHWQTSLSGDGKTVLLTHVGIGFTMSFR